MATVRTARPVPTSRRSTTPAPGAEPSGSGPPAQVTTPSRRDRFDPSAFSTEADLRLRTGAVAGSGPTRTAVPDLLSDWRDATLQATARELARDELRPELQQLLQSVAQSNGGTLSPEDEQAISHHFFAQNKHRLDGLAQTHHADLTKTPKHIERTLSRVVVERRPLVTRKRDPFTPIALGDPAARAKERVLWESPRLMVIVDLFAPCPKALVVPKKSVMFPVEADAALLTELAQVAAHVSDALSDVTGAPPSGIWINPPQHLMVRQLHVHVLPQAADYAPTGEPLLRAAAADPAVLVQAEALFKQVAAAIEQRLGPAS